MPLRHSFHALTDIERAICGKMRRSQPAVESADSAQARGIVEARLRVNRLCVRRSRWNNIVLMAIGKEPERRYGSSQTAASDISSTRKAIPHRARDHPCQCRSANSSEPSLASGDLAGVVF